MQRFILLFFLLACLSACQQKDAEQARLEEEISSLEKQILKTGDASENKKAAKELVEKTSSFAEKFPENGQTPELLFKAADVARGAREYGKAIQLWGRVWRDYSDHPKAPVALFLQGFTFDTDLKDDRNAKKYYQNFLKQYPNDSLATQVRQLLSVVEVEPNELIRQFREEQ